jgi:DNA-binding response OmpR family regulator
VDATGEPSVTPFVPGSIVPLPSPAGRPGTPGRSALPRVVMHVTAAPADSPVLSLLEAQGFDLVGCPDAHALLEEVMHRVPDAVIYALHADCREDLGVLRLLRRAVPDVPLVLLAAEDSLDTRKITQTLRPIYYAVCPIDGAELCDVVRTAVSRRGRLT